MAVTVQKIQVEVRVAGRIVPNVLEVSSSAGFEQINAEATIWTTARPSWVEEAQAATIWARGTAQGQIFGGEVVGIDWSYAPEKIGIICRDLLARTRLEWGGGEYVYTSQDDAAIIRNLLEKMAIPSGMASITSSSWILATVEDIILKDGDVPYSIIQSIDDLAGYKTFSLTTGIIVRRRISGIPGPAGALSFSKGVTILSDARRQRGVISPVNRAVVSGLTYEGLTIGGPGVGEASAPNPYIPNPPGYVTETVQSNLIEDDPRALSIAQRIVSDKNRRPEGIDFSIPLDPRVQPGMTVQVVHPSLETGTATVFVSYVGHSISSAGARTTIRTTGGNLSGYSLASPVPNFTVQLFLEGEDTGAGVDGLIVGVCDATGSFDPDGTITTYAWTASGTGGTPDPASGSSSIFRFTVTSAATEVVITLTVTDADGLTGVLALTIPIDITTMMVEDLYIAYGDVACSSDGEQTWRTATPASGSAISLAAFAPAWGQVWGTTTGHVYATFDKLQSTLVDLGQPNGTADCTALWVHELDQTRLWAGFDDGKVYSGIVDTAVQTCVFTLAGTVPGGSVVEIRESYGLLGELRATAGAGYYYSANGGASWSLQHTFDVAWRMAAGFDTNLASGLNDAAPLYDEDGTPPTVPGGVIHIRGLTFGWRTQALYAADDNANLYTSDSTFAALTAHADNTNAIVNHMVRSGNVDGPVIYMAVGDGAGVDNGFQKWIPGVKAPFYVRKTTAAKGYMIGYGPLHTPDVSTSLLRPTFGDNPGGVWARILGTWALKNTGLPTAKYWRWIAADPTNKARWLLLGNSTGSLTSSHPVVAGNLKMTDGTTNPLWITEDFGTTWNSIALPVSGGYTSTVIYNVEWSEQNTGEWSIYGAANSGSSYAAVWRGDTTSATFAVDTGVGIATIIGYCPPGVSGEQIGITDFVFGYFADGSSSFTALAGTPTWLGNLAMERMMGLNRGCVGVSDIDGDFFAVPDYRATLPIQQLAAQGVWTTTTADGFAYIGGRANGIVKVTSPLAGASAAVVAASGNAVGFIRSDRQRRVSVGATKANDTYVYENGVWALIAAPGGATTLADRLELLT